MTFAAALAFLALHAPVPANVTVHWQACPDSAVPVSCATPSTREVFLEPEIKSSDVKDWLPALAHEIGHIWDYDHMTDAARARYVDFVRAPAGSTWWNTGQSDGFFSQLPPGELFADAYALCALGRRYRDRNLDSWPYYLTPEGHFMRRVTVASTCWLLRHPPAG